MRLKGRPPELRRNVGEELLVLCLRVVGEYELLLLLQYLTAVK